MTDAEISRAVALAIGYAPESVQIALGECQVFRTVQKRADYLDASRPWNEPTDAWHSFDYREPTVALPLLKWLMVEHDPMLLWNRAIPAFAIDLPNKTIHADTLEEAIARAVIAVRMKP